MSLEAIRQQIRVIASGVPGVGRIHDYERFSAEYSKFLELFKVDGRINGFMFFRIQRIERFLAAGESEIAHVFRFRRLCGLEDAEATGIAFDDHVEDLCSAFNLRDDLNESCDTINPDWGPMQGMRGPQIETIDIRKFGSVLCHFAEGRLCAVETLDIEEERSDIGAEWGEFAWGSIPWGCVA